MKKLNQSDLPIFNAEGSIFMGAKREKIDSKIGIYGVPYDGTTSFRPGTRFGPSAIREVSSSLETYCPQFNLDLEELAFTDLGSLEIPFGAPEPVIQRVNKATKQLLKNPKLDESIKQAFTKSNSENEL